MVEQPTGTLTFLFTDVEGSTRLWEQHPAEMQAALERHDEILRSAIENHDGYVFSTAGDAFAAAFERAGDAVAAAIEAQRSLRAERWPETAVVRVRMGLHTGEAQERGGDYFGPVLNRAARIMSAGHGGQILVSATTVGLIEGAQLLDLGEYRLKDLAAPERLSQIGRESFPALRSLDTARHNLPTERSPLVGRKAEIEQIAGWVTEHRLVTLLGIGGTGKTRLAAAAAAELADRFTDGVWFVNLVPASGVGEVVEAIATAAGLQVGGRDVVEALAELISDRDMLIVLDNCEHITDDVADVVDLLMISTTAPRFIATSREPLQLIGERQVHVAPLSVDRDLAAPAIELFTAAARLVDVAVGADDVELVAHICEQLDGLPLSLELAAAQLRQLSLGELAERLDRRFELLSQRRGGRGRRQASLLGVLEDSWQMLDQPEHELLRLLAAFPAGFDVQGVEGAAGDLSVGIPANTLGGLIDRSLVAPSDDGRHKLLETVKLFARQQWANVDDPDVYLDHHTRWVVDHLTGCPEQEWYTSFEIARWSNRHYEDHRAVEDRLASTGDTGDLSRLVASLTNSYFFASGQRASALIDRVGGYLEQLTLSDHERGLLNLVAATSGVPSRRPEWIGTGSKRAVALLRPHGESEELAMALIVWSWMTAFSELDAALGLLDEAMIVAEDVGGNSMVDLALSYRANHLALHGRIDEATESLEQLRARLEGSDFDHSGHFYNCVLIAINVISAPETSGAASSINRTELFRALGRSAIHWGSFGLLSIGAAATGEIDTARALIDETESAVENDADDGLPDLLVPFATLAWALGSPQLTARWITAVRRSPTPTANFGFTIAYRQLRDAVGLLDENPLDDATIEEIHQEATDWLASL
jgi:predicted ATPase/class 3 adenylate cyclase